MSFSLEIKARARALYIEEGLTIDEVSAETAVSGTQLKVWSKDGEWGRERDEFERAFLSLQSKMQKLKVKLADDALDSGDPQKIYALGGLIRATAPRATRARQDDKAAQFLDWMGGLLSYIEGKEPDALRVLEPHIRGFADSMKEGAAP